MNLVVISSKRCWHAPSSPSGFTTDGGFPMQMRALSQLFDHTTLVVPCLPTGPDAASTPLVGHNMSVMAMTYPRGRGWRRKLDFPFWLVRNLPVVVRELLRADAIHALIPGDVGTVGMMLAVLLRKPLFVRHCGNWLAPSTSVERFWKWFMETFAGGRNLMLATGGSDRAPSQRNSEVRWIFSTSLTGQQLQECSAGCVPETKRRTRLIITCRQERLKGTALILESLSLLKRDFPEIAFDVVGDGTDLSWFKQRASELQVQDRVRFHGNVDHASVMRLLKEADLFVFPSRSSEGFPKAVLEALACGLPVVTTPVSVLPQLIRRGCGRILEETTPEALAASVKECLEDPVRYQAMSRSALETAQAYSLEGWRDTIGELLTPAWGRLKSGPPEPATQEVSTVVAKL